MVTLVSGASYVWIWKFWIFTILQFKFAEVYVRHPGSWIQKLLVISGLFISKSKVTFSSSDSDPELFGSGSGLTDASGSGLSDRAPICNK
jgi:hypothetical protein